jgi:CheY-like chemotaxis protein
VVEAADANEALDALAHRFDVKRNRIEITAELGAGTARKRMIRASVELKGLSRVVRSVYPQWHPVRPDELVLSDVQMPGSMDGVPAIKIVLTSGRSTVVDGAEHDGFFPKPCDFVKLVKRIETLLD